MFSQLFLYIRKPVPFTEIKLSRDYVIYQKSPISIGESKITRIGGELLHTNERNDA